MTSSFFFIGLRRHTCSPVTTIIFYEGRLTVDQAGRWPQDTLALQWVVHTLVNTFRVGAVCLLNLRFLAMGVECIYAPSAFRRTEC